MLCDNASDEREDRSDDALDVELPQEITDDLQVFMPVLGCLNNNHSCHRLVCPVPIFDLVILLVWQSVGMACRIVSNESYILETIA